jgi:molybdate transport system ATP-binding protein
MIQVTIQKKLLSAKGEMILDVDFEIMPGELVTLYGPSGAGKTSILRMLCGLAKPDNGSIVVEGETWFDSVKKINLKPQGRNVGIVFQDYALFPNMTVKENLAYARDNNRK